MRKKSISAAFTIVELLVVIAVIGILALIVIVAYKGIQSKAHVASLQSDLTSGAKLLTIDDLKNKTFPASEELANYGDGLPRSANNVITYVPSTDQSSFCLQAVYNDLSYYVTNTNSNPTAGTCSVPPPAPPPPPPPAPSCDDYSVGDTGPGGGLIVYVASSPQSWGCYLEAANSTSGGGWWCNNSNSCNEPTYVWGCRGTSVSTATGIGTGMQNTINIISACPSASTAAYKAHSYRGGGFDDWYLPSKSEIDKLMDYQTTLGIKNGSGWMAGTYWSSTQYSSTQGVNYLTHGTACFILCVTVYDSFTQEYKDNSMFKFVRPVRVF